MPRVNATQVGISVVPSAKSVFESAFIAETFNCLPNLYFMMGQAKQCIMLAYAIGPDLLASNSYLSQALIIGTNYKLIIIDATIL